MQKEVKLFFYLVISILIVMPASALIITPQEIMLEDYSSAQEQIITVLNDDFEPVGFELSLDYHSSYLAEYISIEPEKFLLQPGEQQNVKVSTSFPQEFFPQLHKAFIPAFPGGEEGFTISFRPSGVQEQRLSLEDIVTSFNEESLTITMDLVNRGNTVLFVTPQLFVSQNNSLIKNITYPQPVVIVPGEVFPLTLRQDNSEFSPGEYITTVQAQYVSDSVVLVTNQEVIPFSVDEKSIAAEQSDWWKQVAFVASFIIVVAGFMYLRSRKRPVVRKEKHIKKRVRREPETLPQIKKDVHLAKKEVASLTKDIKKFVDEADHWIKKNK